MNLQSLSGKWHIHLTNFPMWLKGDKTHPTFNYSLAKKGEVQGLRDEVSYLKKGKLRSIIGFDSPVSGSDTQFIWRGKGILSLLKSAWEVRYVDPTHEWVLIQFEKTLFTPKGYDVISKSPQLKPEIIAEIRIKLKALGIADELKLISGE